MRITKHQDTEVLDWRVRLWLDYRRIPLQDYRNLPPHCKDWLHDAVCGGARAPSDRQLRDLAQELHLSELRTDVRPNGHSSRPVELIPHHDLREFFSLPADETRRHLSRY